MGPRATTRQHRRSTAGRVLSVLAVVLAGALVLVAPPARAAGQTVVSLTFDDGQSSQFDVLPILQSHGMHGTFYVNSGLVGQAGTYYMNWAKIHQIADAGNEIGGHTLSHQNLTTVDAATATTQVCQDRANLVAQGFSPVSFAYPEAGVNAGVEQIVQQCGYTSARTVGGTSYRESIPPTDPMNVRTPAPADSSMTAQSFEDVVTRAENAGGGWVVFVFHGTCEDLQCTGSSASKLSTISTFLDWLQARSATGTVVRTVGDVMGGGSTPPPAGNAPSTTISCNGAACQTTAYGAPVTVTLQATDPEGDATTTYYTTDGSTPTTSSTRYTAAFVVNQTSTVRFFSRDATGLSETPSSQTITVGTTPPPPPPPPTAKTVVSLTFDDAQASQINVVPIIKAHGMKGTFYVESGDVGQGTYYMNWDQIRTVADAGNEIGGHTLHHPDLTTLSTAAAKASICDDRANLIAHGYTPSSFAYPYAASNATIESLVQQCGYASARTVGGTTTHETIPPADPYWLRTPAPADSSTGLAGLKQGVLNAENSGGGWAIMVFHGVCDNACTGSDAVTIGDFTAFLDWLQARQTNGTVVRTVGDVMGTPVTPPAGSAPTTTIACNGAACTAGAYSSAVSVTLSATDPDGNAITTYYTTDGSDPTTSSTRVPYSGSFSVAQTSTVRYYSVDSTGLAEAVKSQTVTVAAAAAPTTTITCNNAACSSSAYPSAVTVTLSATDPQGSATTTYYTTDGSDPTTSSTRTTYAGAFSVAATRTVRYYSRDALGASETPRQQLITVSAASAPTTTISCNGTACSTGWYRTAPVTVRLAATDPNGDATTTYYTTDGSDPTSSSTRTTYTGAFPVGRTTNVRYYSTDATGRSEPAKQQQVLVDTAAPSVTITSPASGSSFSRRSTVTLSATATDSGTGGAAASGVSRVVFYLDGASIGTVTTPLSGTTTYRYSWYAQASTGPHTLTAVAYDGAGSSRTSAGVNITLRR